MNSIIYRGSSVLNGAPIIAVAMAKGNRKTGKGMMQVYIMADRIDPRYASKCGADEAICGDCPHRGEVSIDPARKVAEKRSCYVQLGQGVLQVHQHLNNYDDISNNPKAISEIGRDRVIRIGAYGDGHALPNYLIDTILLYSKGHTAYTHQADHPKVDFRPDLYMVSVESMLQARRWWSKGVRTFRTLREGGSLAKGEILCPASVEAGKRVLCEACLLCGGTSVKARNIAIYAHGAGKMHHI